MSFRTTTRSPRARATGLGSAKCGTEHWWAERVSAIALVPLTLWFVASLIAHAGADYAGFTAWRGVTAEPFPLEAAAETWGRGSEFGATILMDRHVY